MKFLFLGLAYFMRMLGPALGYTLASMCLKIYVSPSLTPTINNLDPRWLGAWWLGWTIFAILMLLFACLMGMIKINFIIIVCTKKIKSLYVALFPKTLPRAAVRRVIQNEKNRRDAINVRSEMTKASMNGILLNANTFQSFET